MYLEADLPALGVWDTQNSTEPIHLQNLQTANTGLG